MRETDNNTINFSFWEGLLFPFGVMRNKELNKLLCLFSFVSAIIALLLGRSIACENGLAGAGIYCTNSPMVFFCSVFLLIGLVAVFIEQCWLIVFKGKTFPEALRLLTLKRFLKILGFIFAYLGLLLIIGGGVYFLYARKATPDLNVELVMFILVSLSVLAALFLVFNMVVFACFLDGAGWLVFNKTFWPTFDNIYKLIIWFLFYLLLFGYLVYLVRQIFNSSLIIMPLFFGSLLSEFVFYFAFYLMMVVLLSSLKYQQYCIFNK